MQIVIDISDNYDLSKIQNGSIASKMILNAVANGTPLPDNATNGDVIKAMFPNVKAFSNFSFNMHLQDDNGHGLGFLNVDWWDAPYKVESEE